MKHVRLVAKCRWCRHTFIAEGDDREAVIAAVASGVRECCEGPPELSVTSETLDSIGVKAEWCIETGINDSWP